MHSKTCLGLLLLLSLSCHATEEYTYDEIPAFCKKASKETGEPAPLANLEGEPSAYVHGCVNVITGSYCEFHTDLVVHHGVDPIFLERSFAGSTRGGGLLGGGWQQNHQSGVMFKSAERISNEEKLSHCFFADDHGGRPFIFEKPLADVSKLYKLLQNYLQGVTNNSQGYLTGQTNLKNLKCISQHGKVSIFTGSNKIREYKQLDNKKSDFLHLQKEVKPNGNQLVYSYHYYDHKNKLQSIDLQNQNQHSAGFIQFGRHSEKDIKKKRPFKITTNDGRWVNYEFEKDKHGPLLLKRVERSDGSESTYNYTIEYFNNIAQNISIWKKNLPDRRILEIDYYEYGHNFAMHEDVYLQDDLDPRIKRVKCLLAPAGTDSTRVPIYQFIYDLFVVTDKKKPALRDVQHGSCMVYNALGHKTQYAFNADQRLTLINKFDSLGQPYTQENLFWGDNFQLNTCLNARSFANNAVNIFAHNYMYDHAGNVLIDALCGNLTGNNTNQLMLSPQGIFIDNGCEIYHKHRTYSSDGFNLVLTEYDNFQRTEFQYIPNSNKLAAKFEGNDSKWLRRSFYEYNEDAAVVKEITDDGSQFDPNNLTDVTERRITYYTQSKTYPVAYPLVIEEKCLDLTTGQELLIHKVVNTYTNLGKVSKQDHYDSQGIYAYSLSWDYDKMGNIIKETNAIGQSTIRRFDKNSNCIFEQLAGKEFHKVFTYDFMNRLIKEEEIHPDGINHIVTHKYDVASNKIATVDHNGNETLFFYDAFGRLTQTNFPPVLNECKTLYYPNTKKEYNAMSKVTKEIDAKGNEKWMDYTIRGQIMQVVYPDGSSERNTYDLAGFLKETKATNNTVTRHTYEPLGRPIQTDIFSPDGTLLSTSSKTYSGFHLLSETDPEGAVTSYTYYPNGKLKSTQKEDYLITCVYDTLGRQTQIIEQYGTNEKEVIVKEHTYDLLNRVIEERILDGNGVLISKIENVYDSAGNIAEIIHYTQAGRSVTKTIYDSHGVPRLVTDAEGYQTITECKYSYRNPLGQIVPYKEVTDPKGNLSITISDALGRVTTNLKKNAFGKTIQKQEFLYDANGNLCSIIDTIFSEDEPETEIASIMHYDSCNRLTACYEAYATPEQKQTKITYNAFGQKESLIKNDGIVLSHTYDELGRLKTLQSSDDSIHYVYHYDKNNNPIKTEDLVKGSTSLRKYNLNNNLIEEQLANKLLIKYEHDKVGRAKEITLPDHTKIAYQYHATFLETIVRLDEKNNALYTHKYLSHDLSGHVIESLLAGNAGSISYDYDILGRLKNTSANTWKEQIVDYDSIGNILKTSLNDSIGETSFSYTYDDLYQLTSEAGASDHAYTYDSHYNRRNKDGKKYKLNALHQIIDDGIFTYEYDSNGNLKQKKSEKETSSFTYDALDRLISYVTESQKVLYDYDENNRRLSKTIYDLQGYYKWKEKETIRYLYQGQNEIGAVDHNGKIVELRVLGTGKGAEIGASIAIEIQKKMYVPLHDHNGNISCLLDGATGNVVETYRYTSFGEELFEKAISPWRFSSKRTDEESGLVYFGRRYYAPDIGRWVTPDPIGREGGPNLYAYVLNNSFTHFDLYGLFGMTDRLQSAFANLCNRFAKLFSYVAQMPGHVVGFIGRHILPIPYVNHLVEFGGWCLRGQNPAAYDWSQHCSQLLVHQGTNPTNPNHIFTSANGICTPKEDHQRRLGEISASYGGVTVYGLHSSYNGVILDLLEAGCQKLGIPTLGQITANKELNKLLAMQGGNRDNTTIYMDAHSRGTETIYHLDRGLREKMIVSAFGPARIANRAHYQKADYYISPRDIVPWTSPIGYYKGVKNGNVHLLPTNGNPLSDHMYDNKHFQEVRDGLGQYYQRLYGKAA